MRYLSLIAVLLVGCSQSDSNRLESFRSMLSETGVKLTEAQSASVVLLHENTAALQKIADSVDSIAADTKDTKEAVEAIASQEAVQVESETANGKEVISSVPGTAPEKQVSPDSGAVRLQLWTATWCVFCHAAKETAEAAAKELGIELELFDVDAYHSQMKKCKVSSAPTLCIVYQGMTRRWLVGKHSKQQILDAVAEVRAPAVARAVQHKVRQRLPVMGTQWGVIDLETYNRNCNCPMCQGIRLLQWEYRQKPEYSDVIEAVPDKAFTEPNVPDPVDVPAPKAAVPPQQEPTPDVTLREMIDILSLSPDDVLADLGCGDGRVLIEAVKRYGCTGVGIEIDADKAEEARHMVSEAGLSDKITIITGDALQFDPEAYGTTAMTAYLYPELLVQLADKFKTVRIGASPFHEIPGLSMVRNGDVWVYRGQS